MKNKDRKKVSLKDFSSFINEEVTIKGNPGVPGESFKDEGDKDYLKDLEDSEKQKFGITGREHPMEFNRIGMRIMSLVGRVSQMTDGHKTELEELATEIIRNNYDDILDGVELDIKFTNNASTLLNDDSDDDSESEMPRMPKFEEIEDMKLVKRIHKAKLANTIIQGEAKNTKTILNMPEVVDRLRDIFGDRATEILNIWNEITDLASKNDWMIPVEAKGNMMQMAKDNEQPAFGGAVKIEWEKNENEDEFKDVLENPEDESDDDQFSDVLDDGEEDESQYEVEEYQDPYTPRIVARGVDFPMLLHEAVKGVFELIAAVSQPGMDASEEEIRDAQTVKLNVSSMEDEAEDFRTGPVIAADFRDFINSRPNSDYTPNMRAFIFGKMMDEEYMDAGEFLELFRGILNGTEQAGQIVDRMINEIVDELRNYDSAEALGDFDDFDDYDDSDDYGIEYSDEDNLIDDSDDVSDVLGNDSTSNDEVSDDEYYSSLSQKELQMEIDDALDNGDYDKVKYLSKFMESVSREIYMKELQYIKENKIK